MTNLRVIKGDPNQIPGTGLRYLPHEPDPVGHAVFFTVFVLASLAITIFILGWTAADMVAMYQAAHPK